MGKHKFAEDSEEETVLQEPKNRAIIERKRKKFSEKKQRKEEKVETVVEKYNSFDQEAVSNFKSFTDFPISDRTLQGLKDAGFTSLTEIQQQSLGYSIVGQDVVGAAKTGSGKTLALLIPLLECLWRNQWTKFDGLGALVISPTRELALQIFDVLNRIGSHHEFSAALLIGGTDVDYEKKRLAAMNIVVCTPGRLLQHMDENESFSCDNLQMLVIDEADRILDMGFSKQINAIIENLPRERQTLLFSATQTRKVDDLVRVSLKDPVFVSVHEHAEKATPDQLVQSYIVCEEEAKLNTLWSFLVNHKKKKSLIFVTCCKQARFLTESLRHLKPGLSLVGLWGSQKTTKRMEVVQKFDRNFRGAAMIATDVASRGLDFNNVDWVVQLDCPTDVDDYIHRVGRTARMNKRGKSVLVLTPSQEQPFVDMLTKRHVPIEKVEADAERLADIRLNLSNLMVRFPQLKEFAQRSFVAYTRAIYFMKLKELFNVDKINFEALAGSYGLAITPRVRFLRKKQQQIKTTHPGPSKKNDSVEEESDCESRSAEEDDFEGGEQEVVSLKRSGKMEKLKITDDFADDKDDDGLLTITKRDVFNTVESATVKDEVFARLSKSKVSSATDVAKKILKRGIKVNSKIRFAE